MRCANCGGELVNGKCMVCGGSDAMNKHDEYLRADRVPNIERPFSRPVSVGAWVGRQFISWIPIVGSLVYLIMLIVWACSDRFERTSKNWAIASIIVAAIKLVVGIALLCGLIALISWAIANPELQNELNNFNYYLYQ